MPPWPRSGGVSCLVTSTTLLRELILAEKRSTRPLSPKPMNWAAQRCQLRDAPETAYVEPVVVLWNGLGEAWAEGRTPFDDKSRFCSVCLPSRLRGCCSGSGG